MAMYLREDSIIHLLHCSRYAPCRPDVLCYRIEQLVHLLGLRREASSLAAKLMAVLQPILAHTGHPLPALLTSK